jgi:uncharacterized protein (DUF1501 family)
MPDRDSLFTTRREFMAGSLTFLSAAGTMPLFLGQTATALAGQDARPRRRGEAERILVVVQLAGGNDGLNTVIPAEMDTYHRARRQIAIAKKDMLPLKDGLGLNPAATGLKQLYDDGLLGIVQGVGYPNPNRSHFSSMDIWHTADPQLRTQTGWAGRYFDACCKGDDPAPEPIEGVALMDEAPAAMQGEKFYPLAFKNPDALTWRAGRRDDAAAEAFRKLNNIDGRFPRTEGELAGYLQRAALKAQVGADEIRTAAGDLDGGRGGRGGELERSLRLVHRMISAELPTRIYYVSMGGFDTHAGQLGRHAQLMRQFGEGMSWFMGQLKQDKLLDRVMVMCFSEFGRRVEQNASGGTDHGEAGPMFVFGSRVIPGLHEKHPSLDKLHRGDLAFGCDFRRVYATMLRDWLKMHPAKVVGRFEPLRLVRPG